MQLFAECVPRHCITFCFTHVFVDSACKQLTMALSQARNLLRHNNLSSGLTDGCVDNFVSFLNKSPNPSLAGAASSTACVLLRQKYACICRDKIVCHDKYVFCRDKIVWHDSCRDNFFFFFFFPLTKDVFCRTCFSRDTCCRSRR